MVFPLFSLACASGPENPSFPLKVDDARSALRQMEERPKPLERPVLVIGGYLDFGVTPSLVRSELRALTDDDRIAPVALFDCGDFDDCRREVIAAVDKAFPNKDPEFTTPVDVIGVSMGGVAARYAAAPDPSGKSHRRLKIARLFTISSPHQGAVDGDCRASISSSGRCDTGRISSAPSSRPGVIAGTRLPVRAPERRLGRRIECRPARAKPLVGAGPGVAAFAPRRGGRSAHPRGHRQALRGEDPSRAARRARCPAASRRRTGEALAPRGPPPLALDAINQIADRAYSR